MRWGKDAEERAAVAKKAHDAYATASAAREEAKAASVRCGEIEAVLEGLEPALRSALKTITALALRVDELERARASKPTRKAA